MSSDRLTDTDSSKSNSPSTSDPDDRTPSLTHQFPQYTSGNHIPDRYTNFFIDSPVLINYLQNDLSQMGELRGMNCYSSVVEQITNHLGEAPTLVDLEQTPGFTDESSQRTANLTTFIIGHRLDTVMIPNSMMNISLEQQIVLDSGVAAVFESEPGTAGESITEISDNLLDFDYLICCQVIDGNIYTTMPVTGPIDYETLKVHLIGELETRSELLANQIEDYKRIYTPLLDSLVNEHLTGHS